MARQRNTIPAYHKHSSGRARVRTYDADGKRIDIVLPGAYGSAESKLEYEQVLAQLRAGDGKFPTEKPAADLSISELVLRFMSHAEKYYVDPISKTPTGEVCTYRNAVRLLIRLYGGTSAVEFGPMTLQTLRNAMVTGEWLTNEERRDRKACRRPIGFARTTCNKHVSRIKLMFKWASSQELIPAAVYHALATVVGLRQGRSDARETKPVTPISSGIIADTLPYR